MARTFGRYELVRELGRGGQAVVYEALDAGLERRVALKVLLPGARSEQAVERLMREARSAAKLDHPNIVSLYNVGERDGTRFLSMEYVPGGSLQSLLDARDVSVREAILITERIAAAAHHAHLHGIVHRDIKPANVLLERDGTPKLSDFGFALDVRDEERLTRTGTTMGTPAYMSPEQARGKAGEVDARSDVYSIGATLYRMLAGRAPFTCGTTLGLLRKITAESPPRPSEFREAMPPEAETICLRCLEKDPRGRYQTAEDLAADCRRLLRLHAILRAPAPVVYRAWGFAKRRKAPLAVLGVAAAAALALLLWTRSAVSNEREEAELLAAGAATLEAAVARARAEADELRGRIAEARDERARLARAGEGKGPSREAGVPPGTAAAKTEPAGGQGAAKIPKPSPPPPPGPATATAVTGTTAGEAAADGAAGAAEEPTLEVGIDPGRSARVDLGGGVALEMVYIPAGRFAMGGDHPSRPDSLPVHEVEITRPFYVGKYEVTQGQYESVTGGNPSVFRFREDPRIPVEHVSWDDANHFCARLSERTGRRIRLPTEAQWEYACRAGSKGGYCFGDSPRLLREYACFVGGGMPHPAGLKRPNAWGLHDMHGNVAEWCRDWYGGRWYREGGAEDPMGPATGRTRAIRGGSYLHEADRCQSYSRFHAEPDHRDSSVGFRVVLELQDGESPPRAAEVPAPRPTLAVGIDPGKAARVDLGDGVALELVYLEPGRFTMGDDDLARDTGPAHEVEITRGFFLGKCEVTEAQFLRVTGAASRPGSRVEDPGLPARWATWRDAVGFCRRLSELTGRRVRLPTEAEWEFACRAGSAGRYSSGDDAKLLDEYAWHRGNSASRLRPAGLKKPNAWGLHDMHGNIAEWCLDWYEEVWYACTPAADPVGPRGGLGRVQRGGSYWMRARDCGSAARSRGTGADPAAGFRVVIETGRGPALPAWLEEAELDPVRAAGYFVEAESGVVPGRTEGAAGTSGPAPGRTEGAAGTSGPALGRTEGAAIALDDASGGRAVAEVNATGHRLRLAIAVERDVPSALLVCRHTKRLARPGPKKKRRHELDFTLSGEDGARFSARVRAGWTVGGPGLFTWSRYSIRQDVPAGAASRGRGRGPDVPAGRYTLEIHCPKGDGGMALDVVGIVPGTERDRRWLPNEVADGRLAQGGFYVHTGTAAGPAAAASGTPAGASAGTGADATHAAREPGPARTKRFPGFFFEAEGGGDPASSVKIDGASGGGAVADFNASGRALGLEVKLPEPVPKARLWYRVALRFRRTGPLGGRHDLVFTLTSKETGEEVAREEIIRPFWGSGIRWRSLDLDADLSAGEYTLAVRCPKGDGGAALDVVGLVPGTGPHRRVPPSSMAGGRLEGSGLHVEVVPAEGRGPAPAPVPAAEVADAASAEKPARAPGFFVEAERGNTAVEDTSASGHGVVYGFNASGRRTKAVIEVLHPVADACLVYRAVRWRSAFAKKPEGYALGVRLMTRGVAMYREHTDRGAGPDGEWRWQRVPLGRDLPEGTCRVTIDCPEGPGDSALDVIGVAAGAELDRLALPNTLVDGRLVEDGVFVDLGPRQEATPAVAASGSAAESPATGEGPAGEAPRAPTGRVPGFFAEAEACAARPGPPKPEAADLVDDPLASGGKAVRDFDRSDRRTRVDLRVTRDVADAAAVLRCALGRDGCRFVVTVTDLAEGADRATRFVDVEGDGGYSWATVSLGRDLPPGRYGVEITCPRGTGGGRLDIAGLVPGEYLRGAKLPNRLVEGRLEEGGRRVEFVPPPLAAPAPGGRTGPGVRPADPGTGLFLVDDIPGFFVEAESGVDASGVLLLDDASGEEVAPSFNMRGRNTSVELVLTRPAPRAAVVFRYWLGGAAPGDGGFALTVYVHGPRQGIGQGAKAQGRTGGKGFAWGWCSMGVDLPPGRYMVWMTCTRGYGGCGLDVVGVVPEDEFEERWLPNRKAGAHVLKERGYRIVVTSPERGPLRPRR